MTPAWSWKLEYDYMNFADFDVTSPASYFVAGNFALSFLGKRRRSTSNFML